MNVSLKFTQICRTWPQIINESIVEKLQCNSLERQILQCATANIKVHLKDSFSVPYGSLFSPSSCIHRSVVDSLFKQGKWKDSSSNQTKQFHSRGVWVNSWEGGNKSVLLLRDYNVGHTLQAFHTIHVLQQYWTLLKQTGAVWKGCFP